MGLEADRRLVSVIGDGSFQLTAQEVANMIRHGQGDRHLPGQQPRVRLRIGDSRQPGHNYFKNWDYMLA